MQSIINFLKSVPWSELWPVLKVVVIVLNVFLVALLIFVLVKAWPYRPRIKPVMRRPRKIQTLEDKIFKEHWQAILKKIESYKPEPIKLAIIEADALVADILKRLGYEGEHMADRLAKLNPNDFTTVENLWKAHRIRNQLTHTPGFEISFPQAKSTVSAYGDFLKEIGVL